MTVFTHLSEYKIMWAWVLFDLPVMTKQQRHQATKFRNYLLDEGFQMSQYSVYLRLCGNREKMEALFDRIERNTPPEGFVKCIGITDKQFESIRTFHGKTPKAVKKPEQLSLF